MRLAAGTCCSGGARIAGARYLSSGAWSRSPTRSPTPAPAAAILQVLYEMPRSDKAETLNLVDLQIQFCRAKHAVISVSAVLTLHRLFHSPPGFQRKRSRRTGQVARNRLASLVRQRQEDPGTASPAPNLCHERRRKGVEVWQHRGGRASLLQSDFCNLQLL